MAVSNFAAVTTASVDTAEKWVRVPASGTDYWLNMQVLVGTGNAIAGFYTFKFYADTAATPTGTVKTYDSSFVLGTTTTTLDRDTGSTANYSEMFLSLTNSIPYVTVSSTAAGYVVVQRLPEKAGVFAPITVYSTSQTITITNESPVALLGGGAGGGAVGGGNNGVGGGGSGYLQKFTVQPGSYALVVGAGGTAATGATAPYIYGAGNAGGASTFAGYTANGGSPGAVNYGDIWTATNGGAGGSGGGAQSGAGGANGANGGSGNGAGGVGSGVTFVSWYAAGTGGGYQGYGSGGGVYAGGGGGWSNSYNYNVGGAGATGGGGGGTGNGGNRGGAGGSGALIVFGG